MKNIYRIFGLTIIILYFFISVFTLASYGVNWDEVHHSTRGQAYLYYFLTDKKHYDQKLFEKGVRHSFYQMPNYDFTKQKTIDGDHPVFSDIMSSLFNFIFYQKLGIVNDFEAYHLYGVVLVTCFLMFMFFWVEQYFGGFSALVSVLSLILYPLFYGESHFNVQKDTPEAVFYGLAIMAFYTGYANKSAKWIIMSSLFFGAALGTKFNILFMPLIILLWLIIKERTSIFRKIRGLSPKLRLAFLAFPFIGFGIFYFSWPHLWYDPIKNILQVIGYYKEFGIAPIPTEPSHYYLYGLNTYPLQWILYTTPLIILFLSIFGILYSLTKGWSEKNRTSILVLLWLFIPIIRVTFPNTSIYGGVRQIMEYIPAMAILAGIGATYIVKLLNDYIARNLKQFNNITIKQFLRIGIVLLFIPITLRIISLFPNESIYFNPLIGGLKGAKEKNIPGWGNSLGNPYRQAKYWLNEHAEKNAKVALRFGNVSNIPRTMLREDIMYSNTYRSGPKREGEYVVGVNHYGSHKEFYHYKYLERFLNPVYEVKVDDVSVLKIWKNDIKHTRKEYLLMEKEVENIITENNNNRLLIVFPKVVKLTRIEIIYKDENCIISPQSYYEISKDFRTWVHAPGTLLKFPDFHWFNAHEEGKLQYLFAADEVQFIRTRSNTSDSCLLKHPIKVQAWHIEAQE